MRACSASVFRRGMLSETWREAHSEQTFSREEHIFWRCGNWDHLRVQKFVPCPFSQRAIV